MSAEEVNGGHVYQFEGRRYPSVTTVIHATADPEDKASIENWASTFKMTGFKNAEDYRDYAAMRGALLHYNVLNHVAKTMIGTALDQEGLPPLHLWKNRAERLLPEIQSMRTQWIKSGIVIKPPVLIETPTYHPLLNYAGTPDVEGMMRKLGVPIGQPADMLDTVVDLKTSKSPRDSHRVQVGGYALMRRHWCPDSAKQGLLVYMNPGFKNARIVEIPEKELHEEIEIFKDHLDRFWELPGVKKEYGLT
jgi:hypothetical protein